MIEIRGGILGLRWAPEVILFLAPGPQRFNRLLEGIEGISDRVLSERLRDLERVGLAYRRVDAGPPVRVFYELTADGRRYVEPLRMLAALERETLEVAAVG